MALLCLLILCGLAGCGSSPYVAPHHTIAGLEDRAGEPPPVVRAALAQLDKPYRYGGHTPQGFDCSGLVYYAYRISGQDIPRTSLGQLRSAQPIPFGELVPGDLLFFRERKKPASHVGLYVGEGRFVHASTSKQAVILSHLANPYWKNHLMSAGRYHH
ncbi:MAG: C40 family peptidase [Candidatus Thiodiazotropha sp.]